MRRDNSSNKYLRVSEKREAGKQLLSLLPLGSLLLVVCYRSKTVAHELWLLADFCLPRRAAVGRFLPIAEGRYQPKTDTNV